MAARAQAGAIGVIYVDNDASETARFENPPRIATGCRPQPKHANSALRIQPITTLARSAALRSCPHPPPLAHYRHPAGGPRDIRMGPRPVADCVFEGV